MQPATRAAKYRNSFSACRLQAFFLRDISQNNQIICRPSAQSLSDRRVLLKSAVQNLSRFYRLRGLRDSQKMYGNIYLMMV
jgi:hypothetical protein